MLASRSLVRDKRKTYLLRDLFRDTQAAGEVNSSYASPGPGKRTVTDSGNKLSVGEGVMTVNSGTGFTDPTIAENNVGGVSRKLGLTLVSEINVTSTSGADIGWYTSRNGGFDFAGVPILNVVENNSAAAPRVGSYATATSYRVASVMRAVGGWRFIKGGVWPAWSLLWVDARDTQAQTGIAILNKAASGVWTSDFIFVPARLYIPSPLASDSFTRANGALGSTDGNGHAEQNGGAGLAWTDQAGTWAITSNAAGASALSGGIAAATASTTTPDVLHETAVTRAAGVAGLIARYASSTDYLICYHDGTNAKLDKVVAGITTNLLSAAATYSAGAALRLICYGTSADLYYNNAKIGGVATVPASTAVAHGLYTTDTGNTFDSLVTWARGTEGQYGALDDL